MAVRQNKSLYRNRQGLAFVIPENKCYDEIAETLGISAGNAREDEPNQRTFKENVRMKDLKQLKEQWATNLISNTQKKN